MDITSGDKDAYTQAVQDQQQAADLRLKITDYATGVVNHGGVDRDWANTWLASIGAKPVSGANEYRLSAPITGTYGAVITASNRAEAQERFDQKLGHVLATGKINDCHHHGHNVYDIVLNLAAGGTTFYSGPEDAATVIPAVGLAEIRGLIRDMIKEGVALQGWSVYHAGRALRAMNLPELPEFTSQTVRVPVTGYTAVSVIAFEGEDEATVAERGASTVRASKAVAVTPEELGEPTTTMSKVPADDEDAAF